ncbi:hypothetical protein M408DRAFT_30719 [Serendipita vermifera MAFF 305830]|uniref:Granulins domain-containing protein n=1 Tax=Serendipita vermifera MAFF 305830 TaxID=933852 RepID=A0A0C2WQX6_SERVB|nr:hypothetical protein M408DRAFT_30719 [Serendipita vermifera MAFF 305830]
MLSFTSLLLFLSTLALYANGASLAKPGQKLSAARRTHRVPRTLQEPSVKRDSTTGYSPLQKKDSPSLFERQATCPAGTHSCPGNGCCEEICCGSGCCPLGYTCNFVGDTPACCLLGEICSDNISGCVDANYVECPNNEFCCPEGSTCTTDASGDPGCATGGSSNNPPNVSSPPVTTPRVTSSRSTSTPAVGNGNGNANTSLNFGGATTTQNPSAASTNRNGNSGLVNGACAQAGAAGLGAGVLMVFVSSLIAL